MTFGQLMALPREQQGAILKRVYDVVTEVQIDKIEVFHDCTFYYFADLGKTTGISNGKAY